MATHTGRPDHCSLMASPKLASSSANPVELAASNPVAGQLAHDGSIDDAESTGEGGGAQQLMLTPGIWTSEQLEELQPLLVPRKSAKDESFVRAVIAQLSGTVPPANWHQATVYCMAAAGRDLQVGAAKLRGQGHAMFAAGVLIVLLQVISVGSIMVNTFHPSCNTNAQCTISGMYCGFYGPGRVNRQCAFCGEGAPLDFELDGSGGVLNAPQDPDFIGWNMTRVTELCANAQEVEARTCLESPCHGVRDSELAVFPQWQVVNWCELCVHPMTMHVDELVAINRYANSGLMSDNAKAMNKLDWVVLVMASIVVALAIAMEVKDIFLVRVATAAEGATLGVPWTMCLTAVSGLRSWFFLPVLTAVIPQLVAMRGGDALTISFNTVAILCDVVLLPSHM
eukprot:SAG31_NODE_6887_length_1860_cov_1.349801_2_plen_397_part_00